ncbi:MAG: signal recognition particle-docking protein FtsY, partial [Arcobacteraceae bacterium]
MFSIFKKKPDVSEELPEEIVEKNQEQKGFFSKALEKTVGNLKSIIPEKKEKLEFDLIEEILIEADMEYE